MGPRPWAWFWGRLLGKENQPDAGESRAWINLMELRIRVPFAMTTLKEQTLLQGGGRV